MQRLITTVRYSRTVRWAEKNPECSMIDTRTGMGIQCNPLLLTVLSFKMHPVLHCWNPNVDILTARPPQTEQKNKMKNSSPNYILHGKGNRGKMQPYL